MIWSCGGDKDWNDGRVMTAFVEVFEVECIVLGLQQTTCGECFSADLELKNEDDIAKEEDGVSSLPHARDGELEKEMSVSAHGES